MRSLSLVCPESGKQRFNWRVPVTSDALPVVPRQFSAWPKLKNYKKCVKHGGCKCIIIDGWVIVCRAVIVGRRGGGEGGGGGGFMSFPHQATHPLLSRTH